MFDRESVDGAGGIALVRTEASIAEQVATLQAAGATELYLQSVGSPEQRDRALALNAALG